MTTLTNEARRHAALLSRDGGLAIPTLLYDLAFELEQAQRTILWLYGEVLKHGQPTMPGDIEAGLRVAVVAEVHAERALRGEGPYKSE